MAPIISGNLFNIVYGRIYDHHSAVLEDGQRDCPDGLNCYRSAYWVTFGASFLALAVSLWSVRHDHVRRAGQGKREASARDV
ncbi:MAG: hypothetical protein M1819_005332 [Sarea resinae]|nr:MAG: hypothetical protein M1819_005332 [Sarea resinae]